MIAGLSGALLSHDVVLDLVRGSGTQPLDAQALGARRALRAWHARMRDQLGPSCGPRRVFDLVAEPLARALGFTIVPVGQEAGRIDAVLQAGGGPAAVLLVTGWGQPAGAAWRPAVHRGLAHGVRWCLVVCGPAVRVFDAARAYARRYAEIDLTLAVEDETTFAALWTLLRSSTTGRDRGLPALDRAVVLSERHRAELRGSLREGVHAALLTLVAAFRAASRRQAHGRLLDESLIVIYRVLFLLFAEARGLVPAWHPIYREAYTLEALRPDAERTPGGPGIWEALQAIARLAHHGCRAGALRVPPFNGRLFSPGDAPLADSLPLDDRAVGAAVASLTTRKGANGLERIAYGDLGVEQLGGVYEHLLDYDVAPGSGPSRVRLQPTGRRKATGSFYTPRSLTDFLVRRTLAPLVHAAAPDQVLELRVLDPAMGSGAFLVAACRYLAAAYEQALVREGGLAPGEIGDADRAAFRRLVAQRCLYGVDMNPMAVQLGRLSLWLATLAADRPLTFLDHRLRTGNSLVGGSIEAIVRRPAPGGDRVRAQAMPLFPDQDLQTSIEAAVAARTAMARTPDDTLEQVRGKEKTFASLTGPAGPMERWRTAADLWCAAWFSDGNRAPGRGGFRSLLDEILLGSGGLPRHVAAPLVRRAREAAAAERFFHWQFEFPEVFCRPDGTLRSDAGFDAIVGNPPWEVLRQDPGARPSEGLARFARGSGLYPLQGSGHGNLYQLFLERALQLLRPAGRLGMVLPAGLAIDRGCAALRRHLLDRTSIDTFTTLENRDGLFPIHRGLKFLLLTLGNGGATSELPFFTDAGAAESLDGMPDAGPQAGIVLVPRPLIDRIGGGTLALPELRSPMDLAIAALVAFHAPALGDPAGWGIRFGRELNATDDQPSFDRGGAGLPVLEGKQLRPFGVDTSACRHRISASVAGRLLDANATFRRDRLGYRDVASATNRLTLIAAIVPAGVVTTHTIFCLKDPLDEDQQHFLCGVFNSYVANYLVRMRVSTHVAAGIMANLPVPRPERGDPMYREIGSLSRQLARGSDDGAFARLNALVAMLYGLSSGQFSHVAGTFPLVPAADRAAAVEAFAELAGRP